MTSDSDALSRRIRAARLRAGLTQEALAAAIGMDRSSLAKVESGARRVSALELARIANALAERIEWFVEDAPESIVARRATVDEGVATSVVDRYVERIARHVEFVAAHSSTLTLASPAPLARPASTAEVEEAASSARRLLRLAPLEPLLGISSVAAAVGLLMFTVELDAEGADGASILLKNGGVAVVNGQRQLGRRRLTAAHELGHYLFSDDFTIDWRIGEAESSSSWEAQLDRFARALLLPAAAMTALFEDLHDSDSGLRALAVRTASEYRVDMATLARRLQELGLASYDDVQRIRHFQTTRADILEMNLLVPHELEPPDLPRSYESAVITLYRAETISAARAIDLLLDTWHEEDLPELATLPESAIWTFVS